MKKIEYKLWTIGSMYGTIITNDEYNYAKAVLHQGIGAVTIKDVSENVSVYPVSQICRLTKRSI